MLYQFLLYSKMNQPYIYIYPLPSGLPSHSGHHSALSRIPCAIQYILISYLFYTQYQQCSDMLFFKIEVQLIYKVVLVSGVQQSDLVHIYIYIYIYACVCVCIYIYIYILFQIFTIIGYYKILNIVPCAMQKVLVVYLFYIQQCVYVNPKHPFYPSPSFPFGNHKFVFYVCESIVFLFCK